MTHTPGPWKLNAGRSFETVNGTFHISYGSDKYGNPNFRDFCELDSNARLISAAPELLASLEAMVDRWEPDTIGTDRRMWESACAAIARAKGEA